jgi:hypothetical protein
MYIRKGMSEIVALSRPSGMLLLNNFFEGSVFITLFFTILLVIRALLLHQTCWSRGNALYFHMEVLLSNIGQDTSYSQQDFCSFPLTVGKCQDSISGHTHFLLNPG